MKRICLILLTLALCLFVCGCTAEPSSTEPKESIFGSFSATTLTGETVNEEIFKGKKLTMVNLWATFCGPCIEEMPALKQLQEEYGDRLQIIGIVVDAADRNGNPLPDKKAQAKAIVTQTGADYLHLIPSEDLNKAYLSGVQSVPETLFVDENGNGVGKSYLGARKKADWKKIIDTLLENME